MPRIKKSRKIGQIGIPKSQRDPKKPKESQAGKPKKRKGNPSGSRHSSAQITAEQHSRGDRDPRLGSKKPIQLVIETKSAPKTKAPKFFSPAQELDALENDQKLAALLDALDDGNTITKEQQSYVDDRLSRHKVLCELLGVDASSSDEAQKEQLDNEDPYSRFESIDINKFK